MEVTMTMCVVVSFMIVFAFLLGTYAMFRMSEHYNRKIREIITRQTERRVERELFDVAAPQSATTPTKRPSRAKKTEAANGVLNSDQQQ